MATKVKAFFVVTPGQYSDDETVSGLAFPTAGKANTFADDVQKGVRRAAAKALGLSIKGLDKDDPKRKEIAAKIRALPTIALDILIQPIDDQGKPTGEPMEFDTKRDAPEDDDEEDES